MREVLKKTKLKNEELTNDYIVHTLEYDLLAKQSKEINFIKKQIIEEEMKWNEWWFLDAKKGMKNKAMIF